MRLGCWYLDERDALQNFYLWWLARNRDDPDKFPMDMQSFEWAEQYELWGKFNEQSDRRSASASG